MDLNILIPLYKPEKKLMRKIDKAIKNQRFRGKIKVTKIDGFGLAEALNKGIRESKEEIIVSLHQDCIPYSNEWLNELIAPFSNKEVVASVSRVELPMTYWSNFGFLGKIMSAKEQGIIKPLLDEKGCAYRREVLEKIGMFDNKRFRTAGEDYDIYLRIKEMGIIAYPEKAKILHYHKHNFKSRIRKEFQLSEGSGALVRIYGAKMPNHFLRLIKAVPFLGWPFFTLNNNFKKIGVMGVIIWIPLSLLINIIYSFGFWKGFISKVQRL